jgi:glycosyltransferase involved in cell wall biosynthesis
MEALSRDLNKIGNLIAVGAFATHKHPFNKTVIDKHPIYGNKLQSITVDIKLRPVKALGSLFRKKIPYNLERFYTAQGEAFCEQLINQHQPDLIVIDGVQLLPYLDFLSSKKIKLIYRSHNCEFKLWEERARQCKDPVKRIYLRILAAQMKLFEQKALKKIDGVLWISDKDRIEMNQDNLFGKQMIYPFTLPLPPLNPGRIVQEKYSVFFHIGSMDWEPNIEGINWFLQKVWARINMLHQGLLFKIAGKNMPQKLQHLQLKGFENYGEVADAHQFMNEADVMIVPLFSGSGIRVKIIEAMAMGIPVISTYKGVEGIDGTAGLHWLQADSQDSFLEKIAFVCNHPKEVKEIAMAGRELVEKLFSDQKYFIILQDFILNQERK